MQTNAESEILKNTKIRGVITPSYNGLSIANLVSSILNNFNSKPEDFTALLKNGNDLISNKGKVVLFIIDALGFKLFKQVRKLLKLHGFEEIISKGDFFPITSTFPSTTAVALPTLSTGLTPSEHGLLGYRFFSKEFGFLINSLFGKPAGIKKCKLNIDINWYLPVKTVAERLSELHIDSYVVTKKEFLNSHFEKGVYRGFKTVSYITLSDLFSNVSSLLKINEPMFISVYWWAIDALSHFYGPFSNAVLEEVKLIDLMLQGLVNEMDSDTILIVTADHGQIKSPKEECIDLAKFRDIDNKLIFPCSDLRAPYLYSSNLLNQELFSRFENLLVLNRKEAFSKGLFGSSKQFIDRVGDSVLIIKDNKSYSYKSPAEEVNLIGKHGGLSYEEMLVPLFIYSK